jgi:hypothetical protein
MNVTLKFSLQKHWQEIDDLQKKGILPDELGWCLKSLITDHLCGNFTPDATPRLIQQAKQHIGNGFVLVDETHNGRELMFDIVVCVPDPGNPKRTRKFFQLIPRYPGARLRYLDEV